MNLNISPSPFDVEQIDEDYQAHNPRFSCQVFFDSTDRDTTRFYNHHQFYQPHHHPEDDCYSYHGGFDDNTNDKAHSGLKLTLWSDPVKWRVEPMHETKMQDVEEDQVAAVKINTSGRNKVNLEDQKLWPSSSLETDLTSNSSCNIVVNNTPTIRVCSDCNTTKTPLWRSGPKGPKSLCNACGIRQRKARRAMAAAASTTGMAAAADRRPPPVLKIKVQPQNKQKINKIEHGQDSKFKKRSKITATADGSSSSSFNVPKKLSLEDFLIKLSKNLSFQRVFPQDEKDAAILLMALSSGLVHG